MRKQKSPKSLRALSRSEKNAKEIEPWAAILEDTNVFLLKALVLISTEDTNINNVIG